MEYNEKLDIIDKAYKSLVGNGTIKNKKEFAEFLGIDRSGLSAAMNGNEKYLTDSLVSKVIAAFAANPNINVSHSPCSNVATGRACISVGSPIDRPALKGELEMIPVIPTNLYKETDVNIMEYINDEDSEVQMSPKVGQFPKTSCYCRVETSAMFPVLHQGDFLALKAIDRSAPIVNGEVYAIDTNNVGLIVRYAYDRGGKIEMKSTPESEGRFEPFLIDKENIYTVFRIVGLLRTNI